MKRQWLVGLVLMVGGVGAANAHTNLSISVGVPLGGVYYAPDYAPYYAPPPVYYRERVYYEPRPVYYAPRRVEERYYGGYDRRYCEHDHHYEGWRR